MQINIVWAWLILICAGMTTMHLRSARVIYIQQRKCGNGIWKYNEDVVDYVSDTRLWGSSERPAFLSYTYFYVGACFSGRVVVRGIAVLTADGFTISNKASPTVIPSNVGGIVDGVPALKSSFVLDCVYELVPSGGHDNSTLKNVSESMTLSPLSALAVSTVTSPRQIVSSVRQKGGNVTNVSDSTPFSSLDKKRTKSENRSVVPRVVKWFRNAESTPFYQWIPAARSRLFHHAYKGWSVLVVYLQRFNRGWI